MTHRAMALLALVLGVAAAQPVLNVPVPVLAASSEQPPTLYASVGAGVLRSVDEGLSWRAVFLRPAGQAQPEVRALVVDIANPRTIYAGTDLDDGGVWKSTDGGASWAVVNQGLPPSDAAVTWMVQLPQSPNTLYARVGDQMYRTTNGGESWTLRGNLPPDTTAVTVHLADPRIQYAAQRTGVFVSNDEGSSWSLPPQYNPIGIPLGALITSIAVDPVDARNVLIAAPGGANANTGIWRSTNGGQAFSLVWRAAPLALAFSPARPSTVYASTLSPGFIFRSLNNGAQWQAVQVATTGQMITVAPHPRDPNMVWVGAERGTWVSTNSGASFSARMGTVRPTLSAPALPFDFELPPGAQGRLELALNVVETERWVLPVQVTTSGEPWLSLSGVASTTPATVQVRVNSANLEPGEYRATVRITSPQAANETVEVPVRLRVVGAPAWREYRVTTLAGTGQVGRFGDGSQARFAAFSQPDSLAVDSNGNVFVSDAGNNNIRRIAPNGIITRYAGTTEAGFTGDGGLADVASMRAPRGLALGGESGWLYVADAGNARLRRISPEGGISTFHQGLQGMRGIAVDGAGNVYVALPNQHVVARIAPGGVVTRFAGTGQPGYRGDNVEARFARLSGPTDVAVDAEGTVYIADTENHRIRAVGRDGRIRTVAGTGMGGFQGDGIATAVALARPAGVAVDEEGNVYVADTDNHRVRVINPAGQIQTIAGTGVAGFAGDEGAASKAMFRQPGDVAVDARGNVYVVDTQNIRIRKLEAPPRPEITAAVNGGDFTPRLAPGSTVAVFGAKLAEATEAATGTWATVLGGTQLLLNGEAIPLAVVSPGQVNGLIPATAAVGEARLQVLANGVASRVFRVRLAPAAPAWVLSGERIVALNESGESNGAEAAAEAGSLLRLYATGLGVTGESPKVLSGDREWEMVGFAPAEGLPGILEIPVRVPGEMEGDVWLRLKVGEAESGEGMVSVRRARAPEEEAKPE